VSKGWLLDGAEKDRQTISARWSPASMRLIEGVAVREVLHVPKRHGYLTEILRAEWLDGNPRVDQVFQVVLEPGGISAWHAHAVTTDRLFVNLGVMQIVLYDSRPDSPTRGQINEFRFGTVRPALIVVPDKVWHGVRNAGTQPAAVLNLVDRAYDYEDPDHWRIPHPSPEIPFTFS
jgi:dTDP-4-dehydrorhamnose 3,5-epimerase